ncbi:hypothetical protein J0H58_19425 [bacterium]|nr:hypothetical protein [bacterium]
MLATHLRTAVVLTSLGWAAVCVAVAASNLPPTPPVFWVGFAVTLALVAANLAAASAHAVLPAGRVAHVALALGMYAAAFPAAHTLLGPGHFDAPSDVGPGPWAAFVLAHLLRAADVLDLVQDWGAIQAVRHTSPEAAALLVGFHLVAGVFVIDAIGRAVGRVRRSLVGDMPRTMSIVLLSVFARLGLAACAAVPLGMAVGQAQNPSMNIFDWRVLPPLALAAVACVGLTRLAARLRERYGVRPAAPEDALGELGADAGKPLARVGAVFLAPAAVVLLVSLVAITGLVGGELGVTGLVWWVLDQSMRGADFADVMQLFGLRLHPGPALPAAVVVAVFVRVVASAVVGVVVHRIWRSIRPARRMHGRPSRRCVMTDPNRTTEPTPHDRLLTRPSAEPLPTALDPGGPKARGFPADPKPVPKRGQGDPAERDPAPDDIGRSA